MSTALITMGKKVSQWRPWQQRLLALAILLTLIGAIVAGIAYAHLRLQKHYDDAYDADQQTIERFMRYSVMRRTYQDALDTLNKKDQNVFFLKNTAVNLAGAELQDYITHSADAGPVRVAAVQQPTLHDDGPAKVLSINVQFIGTTTALQKVLLQLENQKPFLFIENGSIRSQIANRVSFRPMPNVDPEQTMTIDVNAYMQPKRKKP